MVVVAELLWAGFGEGLVVISGQDECVEGTEHQQKSCFCDTPGGNLARKMRGKWLILCRATGNNAHLL